MVLDAFGAGFVGLINVDALDGAAKCFGKLALVWGLAADGVVEDEDLGGARARWKMLFENWYSCTWLIFWSSPRQEMVHSRRLQNILDFRIIDLLDFLLILKRSFPADMSIDLETRLI